MAARHCPVSALEPMKFFGIVSWTTARVVLVFVAISRWTGTTLFGWMAAGIVISYIYEKATAGQPGNFLMQRWSAAMDEPFAQRYLAPIRKGLHRVWREAGLLPPPGSQSFYEP